MQKNPETVKKIIRAIAKAVMYFRTNKEGSIAVLRHHIGSIKTDEEAGLIWDQLHNTFGAEVPKDLFREIFESRRLTMIAARQWPDDKPLPDPERLHWPASCSIRRSRTWATCRPTWLHPRRRTDIGLVHPPLLACEERRSNAISFSRRGFLRVRAMRHAIAKNDAALSTFVG